MSGALVFIAVLSVLVVVHEFGHFIVARLYGIRVEKFSIGFGPVIFRKRAGETEYCFSVLPFGGFVKLAGESEGESRGNPWEFTAKPLAQKFLVVLAGPIMNAFLAVVLFFIVFLWGQPLLTTRVGKVMDSSPAKAAGILENDRITSVDGKAVQYWEDVLEAIQSDSDGELVLSVERGEETLSVTVTANQKDGLDTTTGQKKKISFIGVAPSSELVYLRHGIFQALYLAVERVWLMTVLIFHSLWLMITGSLPFKESMTGPIGIYFLTQQAAQVGVYYLLYFTGSLSVSLFVLNLLPIPVLDGGHLLFFAVEKIKGSPLKDIVKERMTQVGLVALLSLMAFVIVQDLHRFSILDNIRKLFG